MTENERNVTEKWPKNNVSGLPPFAYPLLQHDLRRCDLGAVKERGQCDLGDGVPKYSAPSCDLRFRATTGGRGAILAKMLRSRVCSRAAKRGGGGVQTGGFPDLDLSFLFCPFFVLFGTFPIFLGFSDLLGNGLGIFPICPFPLSRPIKSTYEEQSRQGPQHNLKPFPKKVGNTRVWKPPGLASLNIFLASKLIFCLRLFLKTLQNAI